MARELYDLNADPMEMNNLAIYPEHEALVQEMAAILDAGWEEALPDGVVNHASNPVAPPAYSWGPEGVPRRKLWHEVYRGDESEGWRKACEQRISIDNEVNP
jgi:hypothetical protein